MLSNCGAGEDPWESLGLQGDQTKFPKGNQPWIFIGRTDTVAPVLFLPDTKSRLTGEKTLMLGKIEGKRRRGQQRIRWFDSITGSMDMNLHKLHDIVKDRGAWHAAVHGVTVRRDLMTDQQQSEMREGRMVLWRCFTNSWGKKKAKQKGERERYTQLNAKFHGMARRPSSMNSAKKKKKKEENNRMGKTREFSTK